MYVYDVSDGDKIKAAACVLSKAGAHGVEHEYKQIWI